LKQFNRVLCLAGACAALLASSARLHSQEPPGFETLFKLALKHVEEPALAEEALVQARQDRNIALGNWLPRLTLKAEHDFFENRQVWEQPALRLNGRQDLLTGLRQPLALQAGGALVAAAEYGRSIARRELARRVHAAWVEAARLQAELASQSEVAAATEEALKELRRRVNLGQSRRAEMSSAQAQLARVKATALGLQSDLQVAQETISSLCGLPAGQTVMALELVQPYPGPVRSQEELNQAAMDQAQVQASRELYRAASARRRAAAGDFLPSLFAEGNAWVQRQGGVEGPAWDVSLGVDLPLFNGGARLAALRKERSREESAGLELKLIQREALLEARQAWAQWSMAQARLQASRDALRAAEKSYSDQRADFKLSLVTSLEVLRAAEAVETARRDMLRDQAGALETAFRLRLACGDLP
jgi:outer membrane protein TolC